MKTGQRALLVIFVSEDVGQINSHESDSAQVPGDFSDVSRIFYRTQTSHQSKGHKALL